MPDSTALLCMFAFMFLLPGGVMLAGPRVPAATRTGLLLACGGAWLAALFLVAAVAIGSLWLDVFV